MDDQLQNWYFHWKTSTSINSLKLHNKTYEEAMEIANMHGFKPFKWYNPFTWENHFFITN